MPTQLTTRGPVQIREFVTDPAAQGAAFRDLVDKVKVQERGPEVLLEPVSRSIRLGTLLIPREAEQEMICRLFGEVPALRADRAAFQVIIQRFEEAVQSGDVERVRMAWRAIFEVFDNMARDIATLAALPEQGRGAA